MAPITHIVLFEFRPGTVQAVVQDVCARFLALKDSCVHPETGEPYIRSFSGGQDNSPEGLQDRFTHGFIAEFASEADRRYYMSTDPAHMAFGATLTGIVDRVLVLDFTPQVM